MHRQPMVDARVPTSPPSLPCAIRSALARPVRGTFMYCTKCGHGNPDDANFCARCGATLAVAEDATLTLHGIGSEETTHDDEELAVSLDELEAGQGLLVIQRGSPDVTVSKIRFLEGEGLIAPERTASGYRKFYQRDLDRLRFILTLQRDSYLPLKVIRERLAEFDAGLVQAAPAAGNGSGDPQPAATQEAAQAPAQASRAPRPEVEADEDLAEAQAALHLNENDLA